MWTNYCELYHRNESELTETGRRGEQPTYLSQLTDKIDRSLLARNRHPEFKDALVAVTLTAYSFQMPIIATIIATACNITPTTVQTTSNRFPMMGGRTSASSISI